MIMSISGKPEIDAAITGRAAILRDAASAQAGYGGSSG
jgi:hypothetical protein